MSTWKIDPAHTDVTFSVKHMMVSTVRGKFGDVSGELELDLGEAVAVVADHWDQAQSALDVSPVAGAASAPTSPSLTVPEVGVSMAPTRSMSPGAAPARASASRST